MATVKQRAQCGMWYAKFKLIITVWKEFHREYHDNVPSSDSTKLWVKELKEIGHVLRPICCSKISQSCMRSPKKSIAQCSLERNIAKTTLQNLIFGKVFFIVFFVVERYPNN